MNARLTDPGIRTRWSLLTALGLHGLLLALWLPAQLHEGPGTADDEPAPSSEPLTDRQVIPIVLPAGPLQLQTTLGQTPRTRTPPPQFPKPTPLASGRMQLASSLQAAAQEAVRLYDEQTRRALAAANTAPADWVADISLTDALISIIPAAQALPHTVLSLDEQEALAAEMESLAPAAPPEIQVQTPAIIVRAPEPAPLPRKREAVSAPKREEKPAPTPRPARETQAEALPPPPRYFEPDQIAEAPPLPPASGDDDQVTDIVGATLPAAPDRGPGRKPPDRNLFFSRLLVHVTSANYRSLAQAVRATSRVRIEVQYRLDRSGRVISAQVARSSGSEELDHKAVQVILDASPMPAFSDDMPQPQLGFTSPVEVYQ